MVTTKWLYDNKNLEDSHYIRREVFINEQNVPVEIELDDSDNGAIHLIVYENDLPVATGRIILPDGKATFGRIAVLKNHRKKGFGELVVCELIKKASEMGYNEHYIHSQIHAKEFYEKLGFKSYGEIYEEAFIPHVSMIHSDD